EGRRLGERAPGAAGPGAARRRERAPVGTYVHGTGFGSFPTATLFHGFPQGYSIGRFEPGFRTGGISSPPAGRNASKSQGNLPRLRLSDWNARGKIFA